MLEVVLEVTSGSSLTITGSVHGLGPQSEVTLSTQMASNLDHAVTGTSSFFELK